MANLPMKASGPLRCIRCFPLHLLWSVQSSRRPSIRHVSSYSRLVDHKTTSEPSTSSSLLVLEEEEEEYFESSGSSSSISKVEPWKTLLEMPARAAWRVSAPHPPTALAETRESILSNRRSFYSNKQMHRIHQEVIIKSHRALANRRERERQRAVAGVEYKKADMKRGSSVQPVLYGPEETLASLKFRLYPNFSIVRRVLQESRSLIGGRVGDDGVVGGEGKSVSWSPKRVIDFGIGNGGASAAALDVWKNDVEWIHGIDSSQTMREGAKAFLDGFCERRQDTTPPRLTLSSHLSSEAASLPAFDLALFAYTATEVAHGTAILAAAAILWEKLLPNGLLVMIEPGTPDGFMNVRTVRNMLLDCFPPHANHKLGQEGEEECHILAPCTHNGRCPMERYQRRATRKVSLRDDDDEEDSAAKQDTADSSDEEEGEGGLGEDDDEDNSTRKGYCSFVQTMPGSSHGLSKGEKFSYLVAQKRIRGQFVEPAHRFQGVNLAGLLQEARKQSSSQLPLGDNIGIAVDLESRFLDSDDDDLGLEFLRGDVNRSSFGRIIHAPKKRKGHVLIDCCTSPGQLVRHNISKSMSNAAPGLYTAARKSRWGGYWPRMDKIDKQ